MAEKLCVGPAMMAAARAMGRQPLLFAFPLVVVSLTQGLLDFLSHRTPGASTILFLADGLLIQLLGSLFAQTLTSVMYLRSLAGKPSTFRQVAEVKSFSGWEAFAWDYFVRVLGWGCLIFVPLTLLVLVLARIFPSFFERQLAVELILIPIIVFYAVFNRYAFAVPLFARRHEVTRNLYKESARWTRPFARPIALLGALQGVFFLAPAELRSWLVSTWVTPPFRVRADTAIAAAVVEGAVQAYFVLVYNGLMDQVVVPLQGQEIVDEDEMLI